MTDAQATGPRIIDLESQPMVSYVDDPTEVTDSAELRTDVYWPLGRKAQP